MKFPTSVTVRGYTYDIEYVATDREVDYDFQAGFLGQVCHQQDKAKIRVLVSDPIKTLDTVIHEILHVIFARNSLLKAAIRPEVGDEAFVDTLACELAFLLDSNGWIDLPKEIPVTKQRIV